MSYVAVVTGSTPAAVNTAIGKTLAEFGLAIGAVWSREEADKYLAKGLLPKSIGVLLILTDTIEGLIAAKNAQTISVLGNEDGGSVQCVYATRQPEILEKCLILAGFYRLNFQSTQHVQYKNSHFTEAQLEKLEQIEQELDESLSPADDYFDEDEDTMPMPKNDPFSDLFNDQTTVVTEPPSFDAMVQQLKTVLRVLRDNHHVDQVSFNLDEGLSIYRRQNIKSTLD